MTRASSVAGSAASLLTSRLTVAAIALAFLGVSTRLLTIEEMAVFAVYNTACGLLTVVCSLGMLASCIKLVPALRAAGKDADLSHLLRTSVGVYTAGAAAVTSAGWLLAPAISRLFLKTPDMAAQVRAALLAALCFGAYEASQLLLTSLQSFGRLSTYNVAAALAQRLLSIGLFFPFGLKGYLAGFALGSLAGAAMGFSRIAPFMMRTGTPAPGALTPRARLVAYSMPFYADGYLRYLYMQADQLLVGIVLSPADLSIYFVAKRFIQYCQVLVGSFVDPLSVKVAELAAVDRPAVARAFEISQRYVVLAFVPLAALLASTSPLLLRVIGGQRYAAGTIPLALLFLSLPGYALFSHRLGFIYALGEPRDRFLTNLVSSTAQAAGVVVAVVVAAGLLPGSGLSGLAAARILGFAAGCLYARRKLEAGPGAGWARGVGSGELSCLGPTALMAAIIVIPHLLVGRDLLIPVYAVPAVAACLAGYMIAVLRPQDRIALARLVPGQGRASRRIRMALGGDPLRDAESRPI